MRTEHDFRVSLNELADQPTPTDALFESITARIDRQPSRRRRTIVVLVIAVVALIIATTIPRLITNRTVDPADTRVPGNWNLTHRVDDMPAGWGVRSAFVYDDFESTEIGPPAGSGPPVGSGAPVPSGCQIRVFAKGKLDPKAQSQGREPVVIQGHPGFFGKVNADSSGGVTWPYADDAWAEVLCLDASGILEGLSLSIAEKVTFTPTVSRLPFVLAEAPSGYAVNLLSPGLATGHDETLARLGMRADGNQVIGISVEPGETEIAPGVPGFETDTINGLPAVLNASAAGLILNVQGYSVQISGPGYEPAGPGDQPAGTPRAVWPAGERELLIQIAEDLTFASDFKDQSTWFEANKTLPN